MSRVSFGESLKGKDDWDSGKVIYGINFRSSPPGADIFEWNPKTTKHKFLKSEQGVQAHAGMWEDFAVLCDSEKEAIISQNGHAVMQAPFHEIEKFIRNKVLGGRRAALIVALNHINKLSKHIINLVQ